MFVLNEDKSIYATRGDTVFFSLTAENNGQPYTFQGGDVVRIKVFGKKDCEYVVLQKDFPITEDTEQVEIFLSEQDTKMGEVISKPKDYWYEIELNPLTNPQTIIGYDDDGAKVFRLLPEGADIEEDEPITPEVVPYVDKQLDLTSERPVENQAVAREIIGLKADFKTFAEETTRKNSELTSKVTQTASDIEVERARITNLARLSSGSTTGDAELTDIRIDVEGNTHSNAGSAVRGQINQAFNKSKVAHGVFLNTPPILEWEEGSAPTLKINGSFHIFYDGRRYDFNTLDVTAPSGYLLYILLFDYVSQTFLLAESTKNLKITNYIIVGYVYQGAIKFVNMLGNDSAVFSESDRPYMANVWSDKSPYIYGEETTAISLHIPKIIIFYNKRSFTIEEQDVTLEKQAGSVLFVLVYDLIENRYALKYHTFRGTSNTIAVGIVNIRSGVQLFGISAQLEPKTPSALILGASDIVRFNSTEKTITFPHDTLIPVYYTDTVYRYYQLSETKADGVGNNKISWADQASSALCVYYNTYTDSLEIRNYNIQADRHLILLCTFRTTNGAVSINAPYMWDGKKFNIETPDVQNIEYNIKSVNHRGYNTIAPENTLSAYRLSKEKGFRYVECDVSFTSDGYAVLLHDSTIDRTSNGTGAINSMTFEEARMYDYGAWKSANYAGEPIPRFEEFIALCKNLDLHPYIELKEGKQAQIEGLVNVVKRHGMKGNVSWISFNHTYLEWVKAVDPKARLGYVVSSVSQSTIAVITDRLQSGENEVFINCQYGNVNAETATLCAMADIPLEVWTINSESDILNLDIYVTGYSSDNIIASKILSNK